MSILGVESPGSQRVPGMDRLAALYRDHFQFVWRVVWRARVPAADITDLAHDVFVVVLRKPLLLDPAASDLSTKDQERAQLYTIASYEVKNYRARARFRRMAPMDDRTNEIPDARNDAAHLEDQEELLELLYSTTSDRREVFVLVELEGFSVVAAARMLNITEPNAHKRLALARQDIDAAAAKIAQRDKEARKTTRSFLLPFGVGAWLQLRDLQNPPNGTAERVWQRLQKTAEEIDRENDRPATPPSQKPPLRMRIGRAVKSIAVRLKGPLGYVVAACVGGAIVALLFLQRPNARLAILRIPGPVVLVTSSTTPSAVPAATTDAPLSPPAILTAGATSPADATVDDEAQLMRQARAAYAAGNHSGTIEALNAYDRRFPAGRFGNASRALRVLTEPGGR